MTQQFTTRYTLKKDENEYMCLRKDLYKHALSNFIDNSQNN